MVEEACTCNWGIPLVYRLPAHSHVVGPSNGWYPQLAKVDPDGEIRIWVDWKELVRKLTTTPSVGA